MTTLYTAVGRFEQRSDEYGRRYPVIIVNRQEYLVDIHEMIIWTCLNWRILEPSQVETMHNDRYESMTVPMSMDFDAYIRRLIQRGLIVSGVGDTASEALYDLLSNLYIVPLTSNFFIKAITFIKLTVLKGIPLSATKKIFRREKLIGYEKEVILLTRQAQLSTAELIRCIELGASDLASDEKVLEVLYSDDETTCDNIGSYVKFSREQQPVLTAVANLYLRQHIIFERI